MKRLGMLALLVGLAAAAGACGNDFDLFGADKQPEPADTRPPGWDPSYGDDKYFYFWRIAPDFGQGQQMEGRIYRQLIDGDEEPEQFFVGPNGHCVGCHSISRDGKYMAVVELETRFSLDPKIHVVDVETQAVVALPGGPLDGTFTSWEPTPEGVPADRFVFSTTQGLKIASVTSGLLTTLTETLSDGYSVASMPSWGPDGRIVYTRSHYGDGRIVVYQEAELWSINADGTDNRLLYADPDRMSYFPEISPAGRWIAFTDGPAGAGSSTFSSTQARIRIFDSQTETVINPDDLNDTSSDGRTWATWSAVGNRLTCSTADGSEDSDVFIVEFDPLTGVDFNSEKLDVISTDRFEHIPRWAP